MILYNLEKNLDTRNLREKVKEIMRFGKYSGSASL